MHSPDTRLIIRLGIAKTKRRRLEGAAARYVGHVDGSEQREISKLFGVGAPKRYRAEVVTDEVEVGGDTFVHAWAQDHTGALRRLKRGSVSHFAAFRKALSERLQGSNTMWVYHVILLSLSITKQSTPIS